MGRLSGKVAIVTGGGGGIGRATSLRFVEEGARVVVADVDEVAGRRTVTMAASDHAIFLPLDASDESSWRELLAATLEAFGELHILVNNAARRQPVTLEETTRELWDANHEVTSKGVFLGMKLAAEVMSEPGAFVNLASTGAFVGLPASFPYSAAKGAVRAMSRSAALHFGNQGRNIRVNVVAPGATLTDAVREQHERLALREGVTADNIRRRLAGDAPLKRMAEPVEIAQAILFLASDEASFVTGAELMVDGGLTAV